MDFAQGIPADLVERYARQLPLAVICELLGLPIADRAKFTAWAAGFTRFTGTIGFLKLKELWKLKKAMTEAEAAEEPQPAAPEVVAALERPLNGFTLGNFLPPSKPVSNPQMEEAIYSPSLSQPAKPGNDTNRDTPSFLPRRRG